ncbi:hypothetical protein CSOJ01_13364 [Colletotrichum sojae]|uniref:Uncharacterized protein n=1 Tax=Colletotrichum sojae TaxID=2175907 RepID=A0A8H6ML77_9PEZI|nr:hypothetical protein CSOJ01_13364 [Colletotrichum sojae]
MRNGDVDGISPFQQVGTEPRPRRGRRGVKTPAADDGWSSTSTSPSRRGPLAALVPASRTLKLSDTRASLGLGAPPDVLRSIAAGSATSIRLYAATRVVTEIFTTTS